MTSEAVGKGKNSVIQLPLINIGGKKFILLSKLTDSWHFRAYSMSTVQRVKEPSGHRMNEIRGTGSVKCSPKKTFNLDEFNLD